MHSLFAWTSTLMFSLLTGILTAGQEPSTHRLTLEGALKLAAERNPDLAAARLEVDRSDSRVMEAWGYALPAVDVSSRYTRALKKPVFFLPDFNDLSSGKTFPIEIGSNHSLDATIAARQTLFNGTVFVGVGAANIYSDLARDQYRSRQLETATKVRKAYYGALLASAVADLMHSSLKNAEDNLRNVELLRRQGILSEYDELRASVGVDNLRPSVIQAENNATLAIETLKNVVGLDGDVSVVLEDSLAHTMVDKEVLVRAEEEMLTRNPNLRSVRGQVRFNRAIVMGERSNYLPTVSAFGQLQYQSAKNQFAFSSADLIQSSQVGLTLSVNLFQGLQTYARVQQAQLETQKSEEQLVSVERSLRTGLASVKASLDQARRRIEAQGRTVETAERGHRIVTARFLAQAATQLEVNDAQLVLMQARVNRVQAVYDYLAAAADLDMLTGRLPASMDDNQE